MNTACVFAGYLDELLADVPDDLSVLQASALTGYCDKAILRRIADGTLYAVRICSQYHIPKVKLIEFLCGEDTKKKSEWQKYSPAIKAGLYFYNKLEISTEFQSRYFNFSVKLEIKCFFQCHDFKFT